MTGTLIVDHLTAGYNGIPAVRDLHLEVAPGEVVALLGPNGAGKTTTLLTIVGSIRALSGSISFEGKDITNLPIEVISRRGIGLVPDSRGIFFDLSVKDHFKLAMTRTTSPSQLDAVLDRFPKLRSLMDRRVGLLSGGEQQMLALAKVLVGRPKMLMVDEMSLGLAPLIVQSLMPLMREAADENGMGVLLVEQHIEMALRTADRGVVLNRGAIQMEGDAKDLLARRAEVEASYLARSDSVV